MEDSKDDKNADTGIISFSFPMSDNLPQSMDNRKLRHNVGLLRQTGEMELCYTIQAVVRMDEVDQEGDDWEHAILSKATVFPFLPSAKKDPVSLPLSIQVGPSMLVPNAWFFGLLERPATETFVLKPLTVLQVTLCPGQDLTIRFDHDGNSQSNDSSLLPRDNQSQVYRANLVPTSRELMKSNMPTNIGKNLSCQHQHKLS